MADDKPARAMFDLAVNVPPADLAAWLMPAFGPDGPKGGNDLRQSDLVEWLWRGYRRPTFPGATTVGKPILEAVRLLEHAELVHVSAPIAADTVIKWSATRLGLATVADGTGAVRRRIKDRTGR
jgi:hypothetical protein